MATAVCTFVAAVASSQVGFSINWNHSLRFLYMALTPRRRDVWAAFVQFHHFCDRLRRWHQLGANLKKIECCSSFSVIFNLFLRPFNYSQLFSMMGKRGRCVNNSWLLILTLRLFQQQWLSLFDPLICECLNVVLVQDTGQVMESPLRKLWIFYSGGNIHLNRLSGS